MVLFQAPIFFLSAKFGHCSMRQSKERVRMCCTTRDAILEVRSDRCFGGVLYRNSRFIFIKFIYQSWSKFKYSIYSIFHIQSLAECLLRSFVVARIMRTGVTETRAWNRCLTQLTRRKSCLVQGNGVLLDTENGKGRSVLSAGKDFGLKKDAKHSRWDTLIS